MSRPCTCGHHRLSHRYDTGPHLHEGTYVCAGEHLWQTKWFAAEPCETPVGQGESEATAWEDGGPTTERPGSVLAHRPGLDQQSCVRGRASRG